MSEMPTFSVLIPCYNYGHFLAETLTSVLEQEDSRVQIILIDDASTDNTPEIAKQYADHIEYIRNPENIGAGGAWSEGLSRAKGSFVMKLDADDKLFPGFCGKIEHAFAVDRKIGAVISSVMVNREERGSLKPDFVSDKDQILDATEFRSRLLKGFFFRVPGCVLRRSILAHQEPPDPKLYQIHDWEYFLRVTNGHKAMLLREPLAEYRVHKNSITATAQSENRLYLDIQRWLANATQDSEGQFSEAELRILKGSCAELMIIGFGPKSSPMSYVNFIGRYFKALKLAMGGGLRQLARVNRTLLFKIFRIMTFSADN